jgi:hypothetical protein
MFNDSEKEGFTCGCASIATRTCTGSRAASTTNLKMTCITINKKMITSLTFCRCETLRMYLPCDVLHYIVLHCAVMRIQLAVRRFVMRHTMHNDWKRLRNYLLGGSQSMQFDTLQSCALIRREWRSEPHSWIVSLQESSVILGAIHSEVQDGLWGRCMR